MSTSTYRAPTEIDVTAAIEQAKREILDDVRDGLVPIDVPDFSSLHDHRDANEYGGLCDDEQSGIDWSSDDHAHANRVQTAIDVWMKEGGIANELLPVGTRVRFRPDFGDVGASSRVFEVDILPRRFAPSDNDDDVEPQLLVGLRTIDQPRVGYRLAWAKNLLPVTDH